MKKALFASEARKKIKAGDSLIYDAVATTLSPKGRNVLLPRSWGQPIIVHDGATVAREVESKDPHENEVIKLIREAAFRTNEEAGDGTTTSIVLTHFLIEKGMEMLEKGINPMVLQRQMQEAIPQIQQALAQMATKTDSNDDVRKVAFISSANNGIADLVTEAIEKVGKDGLVTVDDYPGIDSYVEHTEGMQFEKGYASPYFLTDIDRMQSVIKKPKIIIFSSQVTTPSELVPFIENLAQRGEKNIVAIGNLAGPAMDVMIENKVKGVLATLVVELPGVGDRRDAYLNDLALLTGATVITPLMVSEAMGKIQPGVNLGQIVDPKIAGEADMIVSTKDSTLIAKGHGSKEAVVAEVERVRAKIKTETSVFNKELLQERLAKLTSGAAIIKVGAKTDAERRDRLERVKDAVSAAKAALEEGITPGGGVTFMKLAEKLEDGAQNDGIQLLRQALDEPIRKILDNAGISDEGEKNKIIDQITREGGNVGYNVNDDKVEDLVIAGVIDPVKVVRLALENAVGVASAMLTTECLIADVPDKPTNRDD